jgi:hypothetical protein
MGKSIYLSEKEIVLITEILLNTDLCEDEEHNETVNRILSKIAIK